MFFRSRAGNDGKASAYRSHSFVFIYQLTMKRHHEEDPYSLIENGGAGSNSSTSQSVPKRMSTANNHAFNATNAISIPGNYSPPSSTSSESSSSTISSSSFNQIHSQLCTCPNLDCVVHDRRHSTNLPIELTSNYNPTYGNNNLLLYYAHLERCRRHGQNFHQDESST